MSGIPITVFTGFLGAGKTSIILSLLPQLPRNYKVVLLKNEFGDIEVDSQLAKQSSLTAVSEILNGCMCCVLVGQMQTALLEIREKFRPDRIIIECSGSAFPATLAFQIRELERETAHDLKLDAIITVIDAENFIGYEDSSSTARMQASYTDIIIINKSEHVSERALDLVLDHLNTLNELTPKIICKDRNNIDPELIFGINSQLFQEPLKKVMSIDHNNEVETITIQNGNPSSAAHTHKHSKSDLHLHNHSSSAPAKLKCPPSEDGHTIDKAVLVSALDSLPKESVWRVKGFVRFDGGTCHILNWAFGRFELTLSSSDDLGASSIRLTAMGEKGELVRACRRFATTLGAELL